MSSFFPIAADLCSRPDGGAPHDRDRRHGANAAQVESAVTTPNEEAVNGSEGLRYVSSVSGDDGTSTITCTFDLSRDIDRAAADVLVAVQQASGELPSVVKTQGVTLRKVLGSFS